MHASLQVHAEGGGTGKPSYRLVEYHPHVYTNYLPVSPRLHPLVQILQSPPPLPPPVFSCLCRVPAQGTRICVSPCDIWRQCNFRLPWAATRTHSNYFALRVRWIQRPGLRVGIIFFFLQTEKHLLLAHLTSPDLTALSDCNLAR
jgi:hypothetical protein